MMTPLKMSMDTMETMPASTVNPTIRNAAMIMPVTLSVITSSFPEEDRARAIGIWEAARAFITPLHDPGWLGEPDSLARYDPALDSAYRRSTGRVLQDFDFRGIGPRFGLIRQPTLLVWGLDDPVIPASLADSLAGLIPADRLPYNRLHRASSCS